MRRPHPRFDSTRNAWVTRAGGRLKFLAKGPKSAESEATAWSAFYAHTTSLGNPVPSAATAISPGHLADEFASWMRREIEADRKRQKTLDYYQHNLQRFIDAVGGRRPATAILSGC